MTRSRKAVCRIAGLAPVIVFCCGFSWGLGKSDPCVEASRSIDTLATISSSQQRAKNEDAILKACPDGAPGQFVRALRAERSKYTDDAISLYREALAKDSTMAAAHGNLGLLLLERGLDEEASVELTRGLMGRPDPRYHRALAEIMNKGSLPALALFHFDEALKAFPDDARIHAGRAKSYVQLGHYEKAEAEYVLLTRSKPEEARFHLGLADIYRKTGRLDQAAGELRTYLRYHATDKEGHRQLAEVLMEKGEREASRKEYLLAGIDVTIDPEDFARKGDEYLKAQEFGRAISAYQTALKGRHNWPEIQHQLGKAQMAAGHDDDAVATLNGLVTSGNRESSVLYDLGLLHERGGRLDEAISAYRLAIANDPDNANTHRRLAEILTWRGNFAEAVEQYQALLRIRGDNPLYHLNLGRVYDRIKDVRNAASEYEAAVRLDPNNIEGHRELARIFLRGKQPAKAEHHYREVLRLSSEDEPARNALITLYAKQKRYDELAALIKDWLDKAPDDPQRHYRMGIVYELKKDYALAIGEYRQSLELQPDNARMLLALGRTYLKTGRFSEAREVLKAAKKADPTLAEPQLLLSSIKSDSQPPRKSVHKNKAKKKGTHSVKKKKRISKKKGRSK